jgi:flagellar basal-body rod protein FlgC
MNLFGLMETSGSAMQAERMRAEIVAVNMANAETTRTETGGPYKRQHVVFEANGTGDDFIRTLAGANQAAGSFGNNRPDGGVHIADVFEDTQPALKRYDPGHPDAGPDGYVAYPDINPVTEMVDLMGATRAYGLNSSAIQAEKGMIASALEIAKT